MPRQPWIERTFRFDFPVARFPELVERTRGTPARIEERVRGLDESALNRSDGRGWTIKQNIGHLSDLGYLPIRRIEQIMAGDRDLIAADMSNAKTNEADHNDRPIAELLAKFRADRGQLVVGLDRLTEQDWGKSGLHPRIKKTMRIVDIVYFDAEHDDYHLARISELIRNLT